MKINFKNLLVFVLATCAIASCQKEDNTPFDSGMANVFYTSLTYGQVFHTGDTIPLSAEVTYPGEIVGIGIQVSDSATGEEIFEEDQDTHTDHFQFDEEWVDTLSTSATLRVKYLVFIANHTSTPAERVIYIKSEP